MPRIERALELGFWDLVCRWADPEGVIAKNHAPHFHFHDEPHTPWVIGLQHVSSTIDASSTKCKFLVEEAPSTKHPLGRTSCEAYDARPQTCRAFPNSLNDTSDLAIICQIPERARDETTELYKLCPEPWEAEDFDPVTTIHDLVVCRYEMEFFCSLAAQWNRNPGSWELFPEFLRLVYTSRIRSAEGARNDETATIPLLTP